MSAGFWEQKAKKIGAEYNFVNAKGYTHKILFGGTPDLAFSMSSELLFLKTKGKNHEKSNR